jgi:hypothetical protein
MADRRDLRPESMYPRFMASKLVRGRRVVLGWPGYDFVPLLLRISMRLTAVVDGSKKRIVMRKMEPTGQGEEVDLMMCVHFTDLQSISLTIVSG